MSFDVCRVRLWRACAALVLLSANPASAQNFPDGPIRLVLPYPPGGSADFVARPISPRLSERLGQQVVIDNRGGAGGNIAMEIVARATPDGRTLILALAAQAAANVSLYRNLTWDPLRDFEPVTLVAAQPYFLVVHPSLVANNVNELLALAREKPGQISYWSSGNGSAPHLSMELLKTMTKVDMLHVPYKGGGPAYPDFIAGRVQATFTSYGSSAQHLRAGRLRALAVSGARRSRAAPELATVAESGVPGYESGVWYALLAPRGTPSTVIERLNRDMVAVLKTTDAGERLETMGVEVAGSSPAELGRYMRSEVTKWANVIKRTGAKLD